MKDITKDDLCMGTRDLQMNKGPYWAKKENKYLSRDNVCTPYVAKSVSKMKFCHKFMIIYIMLTIPIRE